MTFDAPGPGIWQAGGFRKFGADATTDVQSGICAVGEVARGLREQARSAVPEGVSAVLGPGVQKGEAMQTEGPEAPTTAAEPP